MCMHCVAQSPHCPPIPVGLQQWLGSSLVPDAAHGNRLVFTFNVEGAQEMFDDYLKQDYSQLLRWGHSERCCLPACAAAAAVAAAGPARMPLQLLSACRLSPPCRPPCCSSPPRGVTLHILRAMRSDRWDADTLGVVRGAAAATAQPAAVRGRTLYHELPDAGHWVHTDNPKGLVQLMLPSLVEAAKA